MMERLTYKSYLGDYGAAKTYEGWQKEIYALRNKLGKYEDLGYSPEELAEFLHALNYSPKMEGNFSGEVIASDVEKVDANED